MKDDKVIFIGDSWGHYLGEAAQSMKILAPLKTAPEFKRTTIIGSTASKFVRNYDSYMDITVDLLKTTPHRLIIFSLGGNDFYNLAHFNDLSSASLPFIEEAFTKIRNNLYSILKEIREVSQAPILISGYDYFNLHKLVELFSPESSLRKLSTPLFNQLMMKLGRYFAQAAALIPEARYTVNWGLLQNHADSNAYPLRGGNPNDPTPLSWIPDGMHPTMEGYALLLTSTLKQGGFLK